MRQDWEVKKLGDVCKFLNGKAHENCIDDNGQFIVVNSKFISSDGKSYKRTNEALFPLYADDIVMVMSDVPNGKALAKCFLVDENNKYTLNQRICAIKSKVFNTRFLYYQLNRNPYFLSFDNGENQTNLRKQDILNCSLLIPSIAEQERIVEILDEALTGIATIKANTEKNLQNARELFQSYLQSIFSNPGDDWEIKNLQEVTNLITCGVAARPEYVPLGIPFLSAKNVKNGAIIWSDYKYITKEKHQELTKKNKPQVGDILYTRVGSYGEAAVIESEIEFSLFVSLTLIKPKHKILNSYFLKHYLNSPTIKELAKNNISGSGVGNLNVGTVRKFSIPLPSLSKQKEIVEKLDALSAETKKLEAIYQQKLNDLEELKKSLLQKAFNGELTNPEKS